MHTTRFIIRYVTHCSLLFIHIIHALRLLVFPCILWPLFFIFFRLEMRFFLNLFCDCGFVIEAVRLLYIYIYIFGLYSQDIYLL